MIYIQNQQRVLSPTSFNKRLDNNFPCDLIYKRAYKQKNLNCGFRKMADADGVVQVRNTPGSVVVSSSSTRKIIPPKTVALDEDEFTDVSP